MMYKYFLLQCFVVPCFSFFDTVHTNALLKVIAHKLDSINQNISSLDARLSVISNQIKQNNASANTRFRKMNNKDRQFQIHTDEKLLDLDRLLNIYIVPWIILKVLHKQICVYYRKTQKVLIKI